MSNPLSAITTPGSVPGTVPGTTPGRQHQFVADPLGSARLSGVRYFGVPGGPDDSGLKHECLTARTITDPSSLAKPHRQGLVQQACNTAKRYQFSCDFIPFSTLLEKETRFRREASLLNSLKQLDVIEHVIPFKLSPEYLTPEAAERYTGIHLESIGSGALSFLKTPALMLTAGQPSPLKGTVDDIPDALLPYCYYYYHPSPTAH